ncbi:hypothetical protein GCM10011613_25540 [Cellvibrio zantedeschiae]|jgi:hypothetical protein|uniref:Uncharacterized protein n=1 Tax=Cellvibrio zantedeschiae TaxID=1237077 RepID=A0ABQ3B4Q4_9GAMM|nr:hypothetical protein GCM10011613_25540 [Cellvibrio zantedeschiae]
MNPFPEYYEGMITEIHTCLEKVNLRYWAKREGSLVEIICAGPDVYLKEFPNNKIEIADLETWCQPAVSRHTEA